MQVEEREPGMPRERIDIPADPRGEWLVNDPVLAAEVERRVLTGKPHHVGYVYRASACRVDQKVAPDTCEVLVSQEGHVEGCAFGLQRGDLKPALEGKAFVEGKPVYECGESAEVDRSVGLRVERGRALDLRFHRLNRPGAEHLQLGLLHAIVHSPSHVL